MHLQKLVVNLSTRSQISLSLFHVITKPTARCRTLVRRRHIDSTSRLLHLSDLQGSLGGAIANILADDFHTAGGHGRTDGRLSNYSRPRFFGRCDELSESYSRSRVSVFTSASAPTCTYSCTSFFENGKETQFAVVAGVLRLSTKYQVPHLRRRAILHLITAYPTSLQAWDDRNSKRTIPATPYVPFAVLELARLTDVEAILPAAMYCCCTTSIKDIFDGVPWGGSQLDMTWADKRTCIIGRQELLSAKQNTISAFLKPGNVPMCQAHDACNTGRLKTVFTNTDDEYCDPLWDRFDWDKFSQVVCPACLSASKSSYEQARKELWNNLPSIFNLRNWTELEASLAPRTK